jgi:hypothetical protein
MHIIFWVACSCVVGALHVEEEEEEVVLVVLDMEDMSVSSSCGCDVAGPKQELV